MGNVLLFTTLADCPRPMFNNFTLIDGYRDTNYEMKYGNSFNVSCDSGYYFPHEEYGQCWDLTVDATRRMTCLYGGVWNAQLPECEREHYEQTRFIKQTWKFSHRNKLL